MTSVFFTYPLEVIRVRLAFETKHDARSSLSRICKQIYHEHPPLPVSSTIQTSSSAPSISPAIRTATSTVSALTPRSGLANFYRGFSPTLLGMLPYAGISFLTHDTVHDWLRSPTLAPYTIIPPSSQTRVKSSPSRSSSSSSQPPLKYWAELISGALAGLVSQTASYPLEVLRRRMQVGGAVGDGHRLGIAETASTIWQERGWRGFWVGLGIGYFKVVPMAAVSFYVYERAKTGLGI